MWVPSHCLFQGLGKTAVEPCTKGLLKSSVKYGEDRANLSLLPFSPLLHFLYMTNAGELLKCWKRNPCPLCSVSRRLSFLKSSTSCKAFSPNASASGVSALPHLRERSVQNQSSSVQSSLTVSGHPSSAHSEDKYCRLSFVANQIGRLHR